MGITLKQKPAGPIDPFIQNFNGDSLMEDQQWRMARDRLLAYLDALEVPPEEGLDICSEVLNHVRMEIKSGGKGNTVAECMRYLRKKIKSGSFPSGFSIVPEFGEMPSNPPVPEINRGSMAPEPLLQASFTRIIPFGKKPNSFLYGARIMLLILGTILIFFTIWRVFQ